MGHFEGIAPEEIIVELKQLVKEESVVIDVIDDGEGGRLRGVSPQ
jgi:hypothetical protein